MCLNQELADGEQCACLAESPQSLYAVQAAYVGMAEIDTSSRSIVELNEPIRKRPRQLAHLIEHAHSAAAAAACACFAEDDTPLRSIVKLNM